MTDPMFDAKERAGMTMATFMRFVTRMLWAIFIFALATLLKVSCES